MKFDIFSLSQTKYNLYFVWLKENISNFMANCTLWLKDTHLNWAMHQMQCRLTSSTVLSKWAINYVSSPSNRDHFCRYVCIDVSMVVGSLCSILLWNYYGCAVNRLDRKKISSWCWLFYFWKILQIFFCLNNFLAAFCHWMFSKTIKLHILYLAGAFLLFTEKLAALTFSGGIEDLLSE